MVEITIATAFLTKGVEEDTKKPLVWDAVYETVMSAFDMLVDDGVSSTNEEMAEVLSIAEKVLKEKEKKFPCQIRTRKKQ